MSCNCTSTAPIPSCASDTSGLERVNYFPRQIMTVEDMVTEAEYFREKLRRHNRYLHGWGVVCGLDVTAATATAPATVSISGGYALGPYGDEIYVAESVTLDLSRCGPGATTDPCEPDLLHSRPGVGATIFVAIRYSQCLAKPVRAMPAGCACEEEDCEYSRVRDSFEISCLSELPQDQEPSSLCDLRGKPVPCPPPPPVSPWVVLATVTLPVGGSSMKIDTTVRRQLFSTLQIQAQVIDCCCDKAPPTQLPLLVVNNVRFLTLEPGVTDVFAKEQTEVFNVRASGANLLQQPIETRNLYDANAIEVLFDDPAGVLPNHAIVAEDIVSNENVTVTGVPPGTNALVKGNATRNAIRWVVANADGKISPPGNTFQYGSTYTLTLIADPGSVTPIADTNKHRLDGEANAAFPSGNKAEGGNFRLTFRASR